MSKNNQINNNELTPELLTVGDLFKDGACYTIPIYQRNYAWQAIHIEQMLDDIHHAMEDKKEEYFLGNLIVNQFESGKYEVIDGQQRLTTLYLLLSQLHREGHLDQFSGQYQGRLQFQSRPRATVALAHISSGDCDFNLAESTNEQQDDEAILRGCRDIRMYLDRYIEKDCKEGCKKDCLKSFAKFVLDQVKVVRVTLPANMDFNRYFEIMNTRGQQLQPVDIVKAKLMAYLNNDEERACFAWIWNACADMDSYVQMTLTYGDTDLRAAIFGDNWSFVKTEIGGEKDKSFDKLVEIYKGKKNQSDQKNDKQSNASPNTGDELDQAIHDDSKQSIDIKREGEDTVPFRSIITFPSFLLHVLKIVRKVAGEDKEDEGHLDDKVLVKRFTEYLASVESDKQKYETDAYILVKQFAVELLRCRNLFDSYIIKRKFIGTDAEDGDWSLQMMFKNGSNATYRNTYSSNATENEGETIDTDTKGETIDTDTKDLLVLQSMLRVTYTSPRTMHWITRLLKLLVVAQQDSAIVAKEKLSACLRDYARGKVDAAFFKPEKEPTGFAIERIIFTYLDFLLWEKDKITYKEFKFSFRNSIEHFYPQHPIDGGNDQNHVSDECLHLLGNLALISTSDNSRFGNLSPKAKIDTYSNIIEQSPKLKCMKSMVDGWNDDQIRAHHKAMVNMLKADINSSTHQAIDALCQ